MTKTTHRVAEISQRVQDVDPTNEHKGLDHDHTAEMPPGDERVVETYIPCRTTERQGPLPRRYFMSPPSIPMTRTIWRVA